MGSIQWKVAIIIVSVCKHISTRPRIGLAALAEVYCWAKMADLIYSVSLVEDKSAFSIIKYQGWKHNRFFCTSL